MDEREDPLMPSVWAWQGQAAHRALRSGDLGMILRTYRQLNALSQEKLAMILGYDKTYISMIETGRRAVHDVASLRHIGRTLAIPAHLLGVTDPADTEFNAMVAFAESATRLAKLARSAGLDLGRRHRLPHQIQRAIRIARRAHHPELAEHADIILAQLCGETLFHQQCA